MRRLVIPIVAGCLLLGPAPVLARYGGPHPSNPRPDSVVDTWAVAGERVVGRFQIKSSPTPVLTLSMQPGSKRIVAWRVKNVSLSPWITMQTDCTSGPRVDFHFVTPKGERVTGPATHEGYTQTHVDPGTFRTIYVHVHVKRAVNRTCELRGFSYGNSVDSVLLRVYG